MTESILTEAQRVVHGDRNDAYGHPLTDFQRVAGIWSEILQTPITPTQVGLCLVGLKLARAAIQSSAIRRDTLVDIAGYAETLSMLQEGPPCPTSPVPVATTFSSRSEATSPVPPVISKPLAVAKAPLGTSHEICPKCRRFLHPRPHRCDP